ncbi:MAG: hypothetical protein K1X35_08675 [Caulobacteraceae bacterium]|nr:hypothetical protein [Caulobacteraceae bacterium]
MRRTVFAITVACLLLSAPATASASPSTDALSRCLVTRATSADKSALMVWMFSAISRTPAILPYVNLSERDRDEIARQAVRAFTRLIAVDCRAESVTALRDDPAGFESAFEALGQVAGYELMSSPEAMRELQRLGDLADESVFEDLGREAGLGMAPGRPARSKT